MTIRIKLTLAAALIAPVPAIAQIKINDSLSVTGWSVGSYQYNSAKGTTLTTGGAKITTVNSSSDSSNVDAALLSATITPTKNVTATFSLYYRPISEGGVNAAGTEEITLLDAYVTYAATDTLSVSAGRLVNPLGYEAFYADLDNMITLANQQFLAPIFAYDEGLSITCTPDKTTTVSLAVLDSAYGPTAFAGDGHLEHSDVGGDAYIQYTGVNNLTLFFGAGYNSKGSSTAVASDGFSAKHSKYILDLWASYQIDKNSSVVAEEIYKDGGNVGSAATYAGTTIPVIPTDKGSNWLLYYQYNFTDKLNSWFGFSGEDVSGVGNLVGPRYWKASVSPSYAVTTNLYIKAQFSYIKYGNYSASSGEFVGTQVGFKF
jgi:hypothetical protein